jgi:hypothetical protein
MSETVYPTMSSQLSSSCNGQEPEEQRLEQELEHTSSTLRTTCQANI